MSPFPLGLAVGLTILLVVIVGLDRVALRLIQPPQRVHRRNVRDLSFQSRRHSFSSQGQELKGWVLFPEEDRGGAVAVLAHGWGSSHGRMTLLAEPLLEAGHPVFLFDVRHHGDAPPAPFVTARHFRDDIQAAAREMKSLFPRRPVALIGHSMGGSTGILAVAKGAPVHGLVTIAAPADLFGIWAKHLDRAWLPGRVVVRALTPFWRRRARVPFTSLDPQARIKELDLPLLIIHGDRDVSVDVGQARLLAAGAGVDPLILEGEGHNELLASREVVGSVLTFLGTLTI